MKYLKPLIISLCAIVVFGIIFYIPMIMTLSNNHPAAYNYVYGTGNRSIDKNVLDNFYDAQSMYYLCWIAMTAICSQTYFLVVSKEKTAA